MTPTRCSWPHLVLAGIAAVCAAPALAQVDTHSWDPDFGDPGADAPVNAYTSFDIDGPGPGPVRLIAGGEFSTIEGVSARRVAWWDGAGWHPLSIPSDTAAIATVYDLAVYNGQLYAAGFFRTPIGPGGVEGAPTCRVYEHVLLRWVGGECGWEQVIENALLGGQYGRALTVYAGSLYIGGNFILDTVEDPDSSYIARYDGTSYHAVGCGVDGTGITFYPSTPPGVYALAAVTDPVLGTGVVAGGLFSAALMPGDPCSQVPGTYAIARWTGSTWQSMGGGVIPPASPPPPPPGGPHMLEDGEFAVFALETSGCAALGRYVYAGGWIEDIGTATAVGNIARWNGTSWQVVRDAQTLRHGVSGLVYSLHTARGNCTLYAGGVFDCAAGRHARNIARWNGSVWRRMGGGLAGLTEAVLALHSDGGGHATAVYAGGGFTTASDHFDALATAECDSPPVYPCLPHGVRPGFPSNFMARWRAGACPSDVTGDGLVDGSDAALILASFGACGGCQPCYCDIDHDGIVDNADLAHVFGSGPCAP